MEPIQHDKRLEVGRYYLLGFTNAETEKKTGVSHGSVVTIIKELVSGHLIIPGVAADQVHDLRQLSIDMAKKGLDPSKALFGIALFERFTELGVAPDMVDKWAKLVKVFSPENFPAKDFFESALKLRQLEEAEGKPFENLLEEYDSMKQKVSEIESEVKLLNQTKTNLTGDVASLSSELKVLENEREEEKALLETQGVTLKETGAAVVDAQEKITLLNKEIEGLEKKKIKLGSEVDGKEKSLKSLQEMNFSEEDLLRLRNLIENMAKKDGADPEQVKDRFFSALNRFGDLSGIEKAVQEETKALGETVKQKSLMAGEIAELENRKAVLHGEVSESAAAAAVQIRGASEEAVSAIRQEADAIREEVKSILEDTLVAGLAVGEMRAVQKNGEEAGKELEELVMEVKRRMGGVQ
ncbi:hypothetical protein ACFLUP_02215 [Chloroflexota bacterium]